MSRWGRSVHWVASALGVVALAAASSAIAPACLSRRDDPPPQRDTRCAECHGEPGRSGDFLAKAAPPSSLIGGADASYPGVGAHARHLEGSERHAPVACVACHIVPERVDDPGHADDAPPAEIVFDPGASLGGEGDYDPATRTCAGTYCHGEARPVWTSPREPLAACGTCHALPPPAPHPASDRCASCHAEVVDADRTIIAPSLHVDGRVQFSMGGCTSCHGSAEGPAPPTDTSGNEARSAIGVGAHQAHLVGGGAGRPLECEACHVVPTEGDDGKHVDGLPAEVAFGALAATGGRQPAWDRSNASCAETWCHAPSDGPPAPAPSWTREAPLGCDGCHGAPPPPPHPVMDDCSVCHGAVVAADDRTILDRSRHVDGVVDVEVPSACDACHGAGGGAPPPGLDGSSGTSSVGVGAHQTHFAGTARARSVACGECHVVPSETLAPGHIDSARPAEVVFSGTAAAYGPAPVWDGATCSGTCHGPVFPDGHATLGTNTAPSWTTVDGTQASCGSCHGLPPGRPHPLADLNPVCSACHRNIDPDNVTFSRPDLHVDGVVTFELPN